MNTQVPAHSWDSVTPRPQVPRAHCQVAWGLSLKPLVSGLRGLSWPLPSSTLNPWLQPCSWESEAPAPQSTYLSSTHSIVMEDGARILSCELWLSMLTLFLFLKYFKFVPMLELWYSMKPATVLHSCLNLVILILAQMPSSRRHSPLPASAKYCTTASTSPTHGR